MSTAFKVSGTNALRTVLLARVPVFERAHGVKAEMDFNATNHTLAAMRAGATADVVIATAGAIDTLIAEGKIMRGTRTDLATAGIGAGVRAGAAKPDISSVEALKRALLAAKSVSYSQAGQSGIHFAKLIDQLGIGDAVRAKAVINASGLVGERVVSGDAELGFQQVSELLAVEGIELVGPLPEAVQLNSLFAAALGAGTQQAALARALIDDLRSADAAAVMRASGLTPV